MARFRSWSIVWAEADFPHLPEGSRLSARSRCQQWWGTGPVSAYVHMDEVGLALAMAHVVVSGATGQSQALLALRWNPEV